jgi:hypothetical protein
MNTRTTEIVESVDPLTNDPDPTNFTFNEHTTRSRRALLDARLPTTSQHNIPDNQRPQVGRGTEPSMSNNTKAQSRRASAVVAALVLAVVASGCGGASAQPSNTANGQVPPTISADAGLASTAAPGNESGPDAAACQLLSDGDATAAMQQPMTGSGTGGSTCEYAATADPNVLLLVGLLPSPAAMTTFDQFRASSEHLDGVGDDAFWDSTLDLVFVRKGDRGFTVASPSLGNSSSDPQAAESALVGLAKTILRTF